MKTLMTFLIGDFKNITRDSMLLGALLAPIALAVFVKISVPFISDFVFEMFSINILDHYTFIMSFLILLSPFMLGVMAGLMILDEMDENILSFIAVTPVSKSGYLLYRLINPMLISTVLTIFIILFTGLVDFTFRLLPVVLLVAMITPLMSLFLAGFANNKIEGLAITKAVGIVLFVPVITYIIESNWTIFAGIFPTYWVSEAFVSIYEKSRYSLIYVLFGYLVNVLYIFLLFKKFNRKLT